jgi:hypothetical protein
MRIGIRIRINANCQNFSHRTLIRIRIALPALLDTETSNASPCWMVRYLWVMLGVFWKRESRLIYWHQCRLLTRKSFFCLHIYSLWQVTTRAKLQNPQAQPVAPGDLPFKTIVRSHRRPPAAEPEASIATVWAPNILPTPPPETFHICDFPPDTKFRLDVAQLVVDRKGSTWPHLKANSIFYYLRPIGAFLVPQSLSNIGLNRLVETFHLNSLSLPFLRLSIFLEFSAWHIIFHCLRLWKCPVLPKTGIVGGNMESWGPIRYNIYFLSDENLLGSGDKRSSRVLALASSASQPAWNYRPGARYQKRESESTLFFFCLESTKPFVSCTIVYKENTWARSDVQVGKTPAFSQAVDFYLRCKKKIKNTATFRILRGSWIYF